MNSHIMSHTPFFSTFFSALTLEYTVKIGRLLLHCLFIYSLDLYVVLVVSKKYKHFVDREEL